MKNFLKRILQIRNVFFFVFFLTQILIAILSFLLTEQALENINKNEAEKRENIISFVTSAAENAVNFSKPTALTLGANEHYLMLFANHDRNGLLKATEGIFQELNSTQGIKQLQFTEPNFKVFLRTHNPVLFGDDVVSSRPTLVECISNKHPVAGLEQGRSGYGFRAVVPANYKDKFIGCIEIGSDLNTDFLKSLNSNFSGQWAIVNLQKGTNLTKDMSLIASLNEPAGSAILKPDYTTPEAVLKSILNSKPYFDYIRSSEKMQIYIPIRDFKGTVAMYIRYTCPTTYYATVKNMTIRAIVISLLAMLLTGFIFWLLYREIRTPIRALVKETEKIKNFDLEDTIEISASLDELEKLIAAISNMKTGLQSFQKYVPSDLVRQLINTHQEARIGGKLSELTVFFSDIANFTSITEDLSPNELTQQLSEYFDVMTAVILRHKGTVDKYIGDAVMSFWGAPMELRDHALLACRAALECQRAILELSHRWKAEGKYEFHTRIGLCTGEIIVGNIGSEKRLNYSVLGDTVNLASRLEGLNKIYQTHILISEETLLCCGDAIETRLIDFVTVKGKTEPIRVYELIGEKGDISPKQKELLKLFSKAIEAYLSGDWRNALELFYDIKERDPKDYVTSIYIERCEEFLVKPPGDDWRGILK